MSSDSDRLNFAYKYPFSNEAKEIVQGQPNEISMKYLELSGRHVEVATNNGLQYSDIRLNSVKLDYVMAYLYSRMVLSAAKRQDLIRLYALAEAARSGESLQLAGNDELIAVAAQLDIRITGTFDNRKDRDGIEEMSIGFIDYLKYAPKLPNFDLVNQKLSGGVVLVNRNGMVKVIEQAIAKSIMKDLPIKSSELPKEVVEYSKNLKFKAAIKIQQPRPGKGTEEWIERLLQTPIADVRHRTVNLILAPYLVNTKGYEVDQAMKIISDYIERCKQIDPNTKINDRYIQYQCSYAKRRGLKPLSLERAKELLGSQVELEVTTAKSK